jgi:RimJ/RimL family protein N-acetyltransferase
MPFKNFLATLTDDVNYPSSYRRTFAIEDAESGRHIGNVMYYGYDAMLGEAELGITIGDREYWSRGFGTDTVRTMLQYLFTERGLRRVYLHTLSWNLRAQTAFQRAGFRKVRHVRRDGYDFEQMECLREDWEPLLSEPAS